MKLFRDKNRGPKLKSEDVVIPEEYLEYEREAEERKRLEAENAEADATPAQEAEEIDDDPIAIRVEELLNTSKKTLQEKAAEEKRPVPDVTIGEVVETLEEMLPDEPPEEPEPTGEEIDLEEALLAEKQRSNRAAKQARRRAKKEALHAPKEKPSAVASEAEAPAPPKKKKESNVPAGFVVLLVVVAFLVATIVVMLGPLMRIDDVQVNDLQNMSEAQVEEIAGNPVGQNLFLYRTGQAEQELSYYPYVQAVEIKRHFPHWIEINITERQPAGVLLNNGSYLQFSKDGVLLDNTKSLTNQSLPLVTGFSMDEVPSPGEAFKDNARFSDILKVVNACSDDLLSMIQEINIKDRNNILAYTSQGIEIRIGGVDNIDARMANLNDIMDQVILSGIIDEPIEAIDIRYEKSPVVVLEGYDNIDVSEYLDDEDAENSDSNTAATSSSQQSHANSAATTSGNQNSAAASSNSGSAQTADYGQTGNDNASYGYGTGYDQSGGYTNGYDQSGYDTGYGAASGTGT